jgi:hypothetical protein
LEPPIPVAAPDAEPAIEPDAGPPLPAPDAHPPPIPALAIAPLLLSDDDDDAIPFSAPISLMRSILEVIRGSSIGDEDFPPEGLFD